MYRFVLVLLYLLLTAATGYGFHNAVGNAAKPLSERLEGRAELSHESFRQLKALRDRRLSVVAEAVAGSRMQAYLSTLEDFRERMLEVESNAYDEHPGETDAARDARSSYIAEQTELLDDFTSTLADRVEEAEGEDAWQDETREAFVADQRDALQVCNAQAVSTCFFRLVYYPLKDVVEPIRDEAPHGLEPDLVVVTDDRGTGRANVDKPKWSDVSGFAEKYPALRHAREAGITYDVVHLEDNDSYYFIAATPIMQGGSYRGSVMVGDALDEDQLARDSKTLGWQVSVLDGEKLVRSALDDEDREHLLHHLPPRSQRSSLQPLRSPELIGQFVPIEDTFDNGDVVAVLSRNRAELLAPVNNMQTYIPLYGAVVFLLGCAAIGFTVRSHTKPLVEIDSGIHEIMNGNYDYEFRSNYRDRLWASMAQSLNRMVGVLLGRELEEDELEAYMGVQGGGSGEQGGSSDEDSEQP